MKKSYFLILPFLIVTTFSCSYKQLYQVKPATPGITQDNMYTFENDTVKIAYSFWREDGILGYSIYNKLNVPIYIDWKKSSFVSNEQKNNYWQDQTIAKTSSNRYSAGNLGYYWLLGLSESTTVTSGNYLKPERITFLAPHSSIIKEDFYLYTGTGKALTNGAHAGTITRPDSKKIIPMNYEEFTVTNSPIHFRNFLTISMTENFEKETYIDNGFYVSRITQVKKGDFLGSVDYYDKKQRKYYYKSSFQSPTAFFVTTK